MSPPPCSQISGVPNRLGLPQDAPTEDAEHLEQALATELTAAQCQRLSDYFMQTLAGKLFEAKVGGGRPRAGISLRACFEILMCTLGRRTN